MLTFSPIVAVLIAGAAVTFAEAQEQPEPEAPPAAETEPLPHPIDCTFTEAQLCQSGGCETTETLGDVSLPARFLIHFEKRVIASVDTDGLPHVTTIDVLAESDDSLILQGVSGASGWTIQGSTSDEMVSFTVASHHTVLNAFGTCQAIE